MKIEHHNSFIEFYQKKIAHLNTSRIDGNEKGGNRIFTDTFSYKGKTWKVHHDSHTEELRRAFGAFNNNQDPFIEVSTKENKGMCLILNPEIFGVPKKHKHIYIYSIGKNKDEN